MTNSEASVKIEFDLNGETGQGDSLSYRKIGSATLQSNPEGSRFVLVVTAAPGGFKRALLTPTSGVLGPEYSSSYEVLDKSTPRGGAPLVYRVGKLIPVRLGGPDAGDDEYGFELLGLIGHFWQCGSFTAEVDPHAFPDFFTLSGCEENTAA